MKRILSAALIAVPFLFFSCKQNSSGGDPKAVLSQFFDALKKKDIAAAKKLATEDSKQLLDLMESGMKSVRDSADDEKFDKTKVEFGEPKIDGDRATIAVKEPKSNESMNFTLKKEKGDWKVAFDKATMMGNAMEKLNEKGINVSDSVNKAMKELEGVNMDSLKEQVGTGMKMMDSISNEMKKKRD